MLPDHPIPLLLDLQLIPSSAGDADAGTQWVVGAAIFFFPFLSIFFFFFFFTSITSLILLAKK